LVFPAEIVHKTYAFQPLDSEQVSENILERLHFAFESLEHLRRSARTSEWWGSFKHPAFDAFFFFLRRKICDREEILRLEVRTLEHELPPSLFVDQPGNRIRECAFVRIARSAGSHGIASHHPAATKAQ